ncbi:hypothetical protein ACHAXR_001685, partial [Thalassiosira sp. AJA248-18]
MIDNKGQLVVAQPPPKRTTLGHLFLFYGLLPILAPTFVLVKFVTDTTFRSSTSWSLYSLVRSATIEPITKQWYFQDVALLKKLWKLSSARAYIDKDQQPLLEYQIQEGFCGSATEQCILRSFGFSSGSLPPQNFGKSEPEAFCEHIAQMAKEHSEDNIELSTKIVRGSVSYEEFLSTLREGLANENVRIACNFLRSALTGFERYRYHPTFCFMSVFSGHFSPILGIIEKFNVDGNNGKEGEEEEKTAENDNPLVAIFDTNHKYNGTYLVPARRLYAIDVIGGNTPRAIVLVEK